MQAVRFAEAGGPEVLSVDDIERPTPDPGEVLVEIEAASVNPVDAKVRMRREPPRPKTTGSDLAGTVTAVGDGVERYTVGDRVFATGLHVARFDGGSFAEFAAVPTDLLAPLPDTVSVEEGAAVALVGVTAWRAFVDHAGLTPGSRAFVHGANGGVGHVAVGLANAMGADVAGSAQSRYADPLSELGAEFVVDYTRDDLVDAVLDGFGTSDAVLDHMPEQYLGTDVDLAAFGGDLVFIAGGKATFPDTSAARSKELDLHMMSMSNLATHRELPGMTGILEHLADLVANDRLEVLIDREYDLADAADAHRAVMEESVLGKILVIP
ncbi:MAG: zinc-binding alcohol dehydrogenase family protein [Salinirussus sp.]